MQFDGRGDQKAFRFRQLHRTDATALYVKSYRSGTAVGTPETYEVIRITKRPARKATICGVEVQFEAKEAFPSPEKWGVEGWTYNTLEEAKKRFYSLL